MGDCVCCGEWSSDCGCSGEVEALRAKVALLRRWVNDLQAGMYINCVYCGHRYGPSDEVPASMADVLKEHIEQCPSHPVSVLKSKMAKLQDLLADLGAEDVKCTCGRSDDLIRRISEVLS